MSNITSTIQFLKFLKPSGPWVLTAIPPDGRPVTKSFVPGDEPELDQWLGMRAKSNLYFQVNSTGDRIIKKKTSKADIEAVEFLHVDIDPDTTKPILEERSRILALIEGHNPRPSFVIDSGGGYQAFWRLSEPFPLDNDNTESFEQYNIQLAYDLGGDKCHNVDRIMRLPFTVNIPNRKKRKVGRVECPTGLVMTDGATYPLSDFRKAPKLDGGNLADPGRHTLDIKSGNFITLKDIDDLDEYNVKSRIKMLIAVGHDPEDPTKYRSNSEVMWAVICELVRQNVPDEVIASILFDEGFGISEHVLDQKNPEGYMVRQLQRAHECAEDPALLELNDKYFFCVLGGKAKVGYFATDGTIQFLEKTAFKDKFINRYVKTGDKQIPMGTWWYQHPNRRQYNTVVFEPSGVCDINDLNLWQGFAVAPKEGEGHVLWLEHVRDNICSGHEGHYEYLINWCARVVQSPGTQSETAIVLRGREGTGKNTFANGLGHLFGRHYFESSHSSHFFGNFNAHLRDKVLGHVNEALWAGDKKGTATLKALITDADLPIEAKGVDLVSQQNYLHMIMSSNSNWVVPAGQDARRFLVLDVSDAQMQNSSFFGPMKRALVGGGYENLLWFLLDRNISGWNVRDVPLTDALIEQKRLSEDDIDKALRHYLENDATGTGFTAEQVLGEMSDKVKFRGQATTLASKLKKCETIVKNRNGYHLLPLRCWDDLLAELGEV